MSFVGATTEKKISVNGRTFKLFLTEQEGEYWVATVLYINDGIVHAHNESRATRVDSYNVAVNWVLNNIDQNASVESL